MTLDAMIWLAPGAGANVFISGRWNRAFAAWLAPLSFLLYSQAMPTVPALLGIWIATIAAMAVSHWRIIPVPGFVYPLVLAFLVLPLLLPYLADRWLSPLLPGPARTLMFPLAWVAVEYLGARTNPFGTWGAAAYTQAGHRLLVQLAALTGIWGVPFVIAWFAAFVAWAVSQNFAWGAIRDGVVLYGLALAAVLGYGMWRLRRTAATTRTVTVVPLVGKLHRRGCARIARADRRQVQGVPAPGARLQATAVTGVGLRGLPTAPTATRALYVPLTGPARAAARPRWPWMPWTSKKEPVGLPPMRQE